MKNCTLLLLLVCLLLLGINTYAQPPGGGNGGYTTDTHQNVEVTGDMKMVQLQDPSMNIDEKKYLMIDKNGNVSAGSKSYIGVTNGNGPSIGGTLGNGGPLGIGNGGNPLNNYWTLLGNDNIVSEPHFLGTLNEASLNFRTFDQNRMTILSNGFVGIGTTNPQKALHIVTFHDVDLLIDNSAVETPPKHMSHYGIRLEDKTTTTTTTIDNIGNSSSSVGINDTRFDLEAFGGNLLIGRPLDPSLSIDKDGKVVIAKHQKSTPYDSDGMFDKNQLVSFIVEGDSKMENLAVNNEVHALKFFRAGIELVNQWDRVNNDISYSYGKVGIGVNDPQACLHIQCGSGKGMILEGNTTNNAAYIEMKPSGIGSAGTVYNRGFMGFGDGNNRRMFMVNEFADGDIYIASGSNGGISLNPSDNKSVAVNGKLWAKEIQVAVLNPWGDYVFDNEYNLMDLETIEQFIHVNHHLPAVPSAESVEKDGIDVAEMNTIMMVKIEELTLHVIALNKRIIELESNK